MDNQLEYIQELTRNPEFLEAELSDLIDEYEGTQAMEDAKEVLTFIFNSLKV